MIEQELKLELPDLAAYERLRDHLAAAGEGGVDILAQESHYLDTRDLRLARARGLLRLRLARGEWVLGFKLAERVEGGVFRSRELEAPLAPELARGVLAQPSRLFALALEPVVALASVFGRVDLVSIGAVRNERRRTRLGGFPLELDRISFPALGGEEYELEIETSDPAAARCCCEGLFAALGIPLQASTETKLERLLRRQRSGRRWSPEECSNGTALGAQRLRKPGSEESRNGR